MAFFGKKFKLFILPNISTSALPSSSELLNAITNRQYVKDIELFCPVITSGFGFNTESYADYLGVIKPSAGTRLDGINLLWQQQTILDYDLLSTDNTRLDNILSLYPFAERDLIGDTTSYFVWDESSRYGLALFPYNLTSNIVDTSNGNRIGAEYGITSFVMRSFFSDWQRAYFYLHFFDTSTNQIYYIDISNARSNTSDFSMTSYNYYRPISNKYLASFWSGYSTEFQPTLPPTDPYQGAGDSTTGGGGGTFDGSSDPVAVPSLPSVGATNTGFISLFVPTQSQLKQVADYLWSPALDLATFKKIFENPMDCILGLSVVPVTVPTSGSAAITVGNVELSGIYLPLASQQYVEIDCGSIPFTDKFFGSYLDQDPYTKMALFVPYSGVHSVKSDDIMGKTVNLKYHIDILTGSLVAFLTCGDSVLYEFNGACASNIPVNSMNYASTIENAIRIAVNIGTTVATAGASAPLSGANAATREAARTFGTAVNMAGSTAEGILSLKPNIDRAGSLGGTTGLMGNQTPYFIITRPRLCKPANQNTFKGYPSFIQVTISDLIGEGYTEFDTVVLAGLYLTDGEKEELKQILESGVYL